MGFFWAGSTIKSWAVTPSTWSELGQLGKDLSRHGPGYGLICLGFGAVFAISMKAMRRSVSQFLVGS